MATIVVRDVRKVFGSAGTGQPPVTALNDVSFEASGHTFVSLVGPSGCGKSTLLNIVSGVEDPTSGAVTLESDDGRPARVGYVFQDPRLLPWRTVLQNMLYVAKGSSKAENEERARHHLELVGLGDVAGMYPGQLSGGMQQRVGIARALSIGPDLLLMDEPFSHLDAITARDLRGELQRLWQDTGLTVLFVTHDVMEAVLLSDRVLMMKAGGELYSDVPVPLERPRRQTDAQVATLQAEILASFEVMEGRAEVA
jgi:NitT/TauT family transport system ATP-binding protein